jgi:phosphoglycerate dehydrogenase-like enzyme
VILVAMRADLVSRIFTQEDLARLSESAEVQYSPSPDDHHRPPVPELLENAQVVVTGWGTARIDAAVLDHAPRLRAIVHTAGSVRALVTRDCFDRGILVSNQSAVLGRPVAEYTVAMILLAAKGVLRAQRQYRRDRSYRIFDDGASLGLHGRRVGIIGASTIGRQVIALLSSFDVDLVLFDPTLTAADVSALGVTPTRLLDLMRTSDVVSLHAPLLDRTRGMITRELLAEMKDGSTFVNTARGLLVDERALVDELVNSRIDAVLDVTYPEPPEPDSALWSLPNVLLTPHVAGSAGSELPLLGASATAEVGRVFRGEPLAHQVTAALYDTLA